ncbi:MAG: DUF6678 family protein [Allorhizobium sp.]
MLYIGSTERSETLKVRRVIAERGLTSHMNDTKWRELCRAVNDELPFAPPYQVKYLLSETPHPDELEVAPSYHGDWAQTPEAAMGIFIEWLKVSPRVSCPVGQLVEPRVEDCSELFRAMLKRLNIPLQERDGFFMIYGHTLKPEVLG